MKVTRKVDYNMSTARKLQILLSLSKVYHGVSSQYLIAYTLT